MTDGINGLVISLYLYACSYFLLKGFTITKSFKRSSCLIFGLFFNIYFTNFFGKCFLGNTGSYCVAITISIFYMELYKNSYVEYSDIILIFYTFS